MKIIVVHCARESVTYVSMKSYLWLLKDEFIYIALSSAQCTQKCHAIQSWPRYRCGLRYCILPTLDSKHHCQKKPAKVRLCLSEFSIQIRCRSALQWCRIISRWRRCRSGVSASCQHWIIGWEYHSPNHRLKSGLVSLNSALKLTPDQPTMKACNW
jgi:hypothetical protein